MPDIPPNPQAIEVRVFHRPELRQPWLVQYTNPKGQWVRATSWYNQADAERRADRLRASLKNSDA